MTARRTVRALVATAALAAAVTLAPTAPAETAAGLLTYLDTDPKQKGPEYAIGVPLFSGGDCMLVRTDGWNLADEPVDCRYNLQRDYAADRMVLTAGSGCFEKPDQLRVGMRMVDQEGSSHPVTDWLIGRRKVHELGGRGGPRCVILVSQETTSCSEGAPMKQIRRSVTVLLATACAAVLTTTATYAEVSVVHDGADAPSLTDIRTVRVDHGDEVLKVRVNFPDLRRKAAAGLNIYVDKNAHRRGPEFGLATPLFSGADYALLRMKRWKFVGEKRVECDYDVTLKWKRDVLVFTADRGCFGDPDELRVGIRMRDQADGSHPVTDWLIARRKFTDWLSGGEGLSATRA